MKLLMVSILLLCIGFVSCKKDPNPFLVEPTPYTPSNNTFVLSEENDSNLIEYSYDPLWRILSLKRSVSGIERELITWIKSGSQVKKISTSNSYINTYFLNKKGFTDSVSIIYAGFVYLTEKYAYSNIGLPKSKTIVGTILSNPYEENFTYEYVNGNLVKQTQEYEGQTFISTYTYYTDSLNIFAGTQEAISFIPQSKHLLKRATQEDSTYIDYTYSQLSDDEIIIQMTDEELTTTEKLVKLKFLKQ